VSFKQAAEFCGVMCSRDVAAKLSLMGFRRHSGADEVALCMYVAIVSMDSS